MLRPVMIPIRELKLARLIHFRATSIQCSTTRTRAFFFLVCRDARELSTWDSLYVLKRDSPYKLWWPPDKRDGWTIRCSSWSGSAGPRPAGAHLSSPGQRPPPSRDLWRRRWRTRPDSERRGTRVLFESALEQDNYCSGLTGCSNSKENPKSSA